MRLNFFQEKTYTQEEVNKIKAEYEEKLQRAYEIIDTLIVQVREEKKENQKLQFFVETMTKTLKVVGDLMRERNG